MKIAALITAKSQSVRVPGKNFKCLGGIPLYRWTTDFLLANSDLFSCIAFSSDDPDKFAIPSTFMPIQRPPSLCQENASHMEVVRDSATALTMSGEDFNYLMLFQPTNPIRSRDHIIDAIDTMSDDKYEKLSCRYMDYNMSLGYIDEYTGRYPSLSPHVRSGNFYMYSDKSLYNSALNFEFRLMIPKRYGYNINVKEDFGIVESLMKEADDG
jgi:CMP-N-acetylneuraminic acid synthetase